MLIREKKPEPKQENPYDWPKSYYMELDPISRRELLLKQDTEENALRAELWTCRYGKMKRSEEYADLFMKYLLELQFISKDLTRPFSAKKNRRQALLAAEKLCLNREDYFGKELLYKELRHLIATYISRCMEDRRYCSVLLDFGKLKDNKVKAKLYRDVTQMICDVPEALGLTKEFELLTQAGMDALEQMGITM